MALMKKKYKQYKTMSITTKRNAKSIHYNNYFIDNKNNVTETWDKLNSLIGRSKKSFTISDKFEIETLNNHFISVENNHAAKFKNSRLHKQQ